MQILMEAAKSQPDRPDLRCSWLWGGGSVHLYLGTPRLAQMGTANIIWSRIMMFVDGGGKRGVCLCSPADQWSAPRKCHLSPPSALITFLVHDQQTNKQKHTWEKQLEGGRVCFWFMAGEDVVHSVGSMLMAGLAALGGCCLHCV